MERFDWKATIRRNIILLKGVGLWPPGDDDYKLNLYSLYTMISVVSFICGHNFFQLINIYFIFPDLEAISGTIFVTLSELLTIVKTYHIIQNMGLLKKIMMGINKDVFQPRRPSQIEIFRPSLDFWTNTSTLLWSMSAGAIFFWAACPIVDGSFRHRRLPFLAWYPYDTTVSPLYELTYIYQILATSIMASSTLSIDTLIAALNMFIGAQCDILCDNVTHLGDENDVEKELIECVKHHREILKFATSTNQFYNWIVLAQFFISAASIGVIMFQITLVRPLSSEFFSLITFGTAVITEIFMYCWFGNEVQVKSNNIPNVIFESGWLNAPIKVKKHIFFFIMKTQQPIKMSAMNLFYLSLETFMKILRTSWSYFAILQQVSSRK